ncbi:MAG: DUF3732 domain-containing protein [Barnesiella sp.]|nr:DUF3732 domain-containing protein [Barnesiella sp.]
MRVYIKYIGILDKSNNIHGLSLDEGLNIITGRSSTGKSAIINIFDYCMGAKRNNIPHGVISTSAKLYFLVLNVNDKFITLAREENKNSQGFIKFESILMPINSFANEYFSQEYFIPLDEYIREIGSIFGLTISDIDTTDQDKLKKKKGHPSVRNMMPFMLQHQNLIANNQALFYRFDDSERRERVIEEFKIFLGLVDQNYFILMQKVDELNNHIKGIERSISSFNQQLQSHIPYIEEQREQYHSITGQELFPNTPSEQLLHKPALYRDKLADYVPQINTESMSYQQTYDRLRLRQNELLGEKRDLVLRLSDINSSIRTIRDYRDKISEVKPITQAYKQVSCCPFCGKLSDSTQNAENSLTRAINWLNKELRETQPLFKSYLPKRKELMDKISSIDNQIKEIAQRIASTKEINTKLQKNRSLDEQAALILSNVQNELLWIISEGKNDWEAEKNEYLQEKDQIENYIKEHYNLSERMLQVAKSINSSMNILAPQFSFEHSPINLEFDIQRFELFCTLDGEKVYLSSMGSGANWLYSHICLFLSLLKLFVSEKACLIPPILFIDQPSQVYFPVQNDVKVEFDAAALKGGEDADEDLLQVANLYSKILTFIDELYSQYGIKPQIIISDHADNLVLDGYTFENYVKARWRDKADGLIDVSKLTSNIK